MLEYSSSGTMTCHGIVDRRETSISSSYVRKNQEGYVEEMTDILIQQFKKHHYEQS